jgi:hypothetical protein
MRLRWKFRPDPVSILKDRRVEFYGIILLWVISIAVFIKTAGTVSEGLSIRRELSRIVTNPEDIRLHSALVSLPHSPLPPLEENMMRFDAFLSSFPLSLKEVRKPASEPVNPSRDRVKEEKEGVKKEQQVRNQEAKEVERGEDRVGKYMVVEVSVNGDYVDQYALLKSLIEKLGDGILILKVEGKENQAVMTVSVYGRRR